MNVDEILGVEAGAGVQTWTMRHAPANGLGPALLGALHEQLTHTLEDDSVAAVVLASELDVFSAGADAKWMGEFMAEHGGDALLDEFIRTMDGFRDLCRRMRKSPVLVIAAMAGDTLAGGLELATACDLRFCSSDPRLKIGVPEMKLFGQMPSGGGGVQFLARLMGPTQALQFILDAGPVTPERALDLGLVDRLCAPDSVPAEAHAFGARVASTAGRRGVSTTKRAVFVGSGLALDDALEFDRAVHWDAVRRSSFAETVASFVQRFG